MPASAARRSLTARWAWRALAVTAALSSLSGTAQAHEFWLAPSRYATRSGVSVEVRVHVGDGFFGPVQGFPADRVVRFEARMGKTFPLESYTRKGSLVWARIVPSDEGGLLVSYQSGFVKTELPGPKFEAYLEEDGLDSALELRRESKATGPGVERYRRCAKTWVDGDDVTRVTKPVGLPLEIVPASRPGQDSTLEVQVLFDGKPLPGVLVRAWRADLDEVGAPSDADTRPHVDESWRGRTDSDGRVEAHCREIGEWLIGAVHMVPSRDPSAADWESTWASLTFARQREGVRGKDTP